MPGTNTSRWRLTSAELTQWSTPAGEAKTPKWHFEFDDLTPLEPGVEHIGCFNGATDDPLTGEVLGEEH